MLAKTDRTSLTALLFSFLALTCFLTPQSYANPSQKAAKKNTTAKIGVPRKWRPKKFEAYFRKKQGLLNYVKRKTHPVTTSHFPISAGIIASWKSLSKPMSHSVAKALFSATGEKGDLQKGWKKEGKLLFKEVSIEGKAWLLITQLSSKQEVYAHKIGGSVLYRGWRAKQGGTSHFSLTLNHAIIAILRGSLYHNQWKNKLIARASIGIVKGSTSATLQSSQWSTLPKSIDRGIAKKLFLFSSGKLPIKPIRKMGYVKRYHYKHGGKQWLLFSQVGYGFTLYFMYEPISRTLYMSKKHLFRSQKLHITGPVFVR